MIATAERYSIKGVDAPTPITSDAQLDHYTDVLYKLERRPLHPLRSSRNS